MVRENDKKIGIVILNYKTWRDTIKCVDSILKTFVFFSKIIIVDNASPDDSYEQLKKYFGDEKYINIDIIQSDWNGGFSYGNNYGFRYGQSKYKFDYVVFANSDIIFLKDSISYIIDDLRSIDGALIAGPMVRDPQGVIISLPMRSARKVWEIFYTKGWRKRVFSLDELENTIKVYLVSGCCFAVNAELFNKIGLLDEHVFLYEEEHILAKKALENHLSIWFEPKAEVIHYQGSSAGKQNIFTDKEFLKSTMYYWRKYEKKNNFIIFVLWIGGVIKIFTKACMHCYKGQIRMGKCVHETFVSMLDTFKCFR